MRDNINIHHPEADEIKLLQMSPAMAAFLQAASSLCLATLYCVLNHTFYPLLCCWAPGNLALVTDGTVNNGVQVPVIY